MYEQGKVRTTGQWRALKVQFERFVPNAPAYRAPSILPDPKVFVVENRAHTARGAPRSRHVTDHTDPCLQVAFGLREELTASHEAAVLAQAKKTAERPSTVQHVDMPPKGIHNRVNEKEKQPAPALAPGADPASSKAARQPSAGSSSKQTEQTENLDLSFGNRCYVRNLLGFGVRPRTSESKALSTTQTQVKQNVPDIISEAERKEKGLSDDRDVKMEPSGSSNILNKT